ncbi:MAG: bifunctional SulP family inorganic anion transporter/carbonic anhydrase [Prosthecobacter sp.]|jgi:carbonic anhydrase|uniref:bifunctional SulP family inorganic anion transporter/carbonic anhydrase n=1 Tax=Prosthecobacter sp. TaxID=1965333 RepID=UPI001A02D75F|nr:solute carrier family 23 protein [Prosthecobacter sp.]MBE2282466.1 bifunctional SulP family inorganic anion transporter/carbonic anhydrase [Prosthecobacter sp.]
MSNNQQTLSVTLPKDITASIAVFLVALPLCLGIALASNAPLFSGLISGIVGGIVVGILSGSHKSVSGPAAGLTAIVAAQIAVLGSFEAFLAAVVMAGVIQILMGTFRLGFIAAFFPMSVIKGLLAAIGLILILKQIPHVFGHDADAEGEMSFEQPDHENTFTELLATLSDVLPGAALIGIASVLLLLVWDKMKVLKKLPVPSALVVVLFGVAINLLLRKMGHAWEVKASHLVQVPVAGDFKAFLGFLQFPGVEHFGNPLVFKAAITVALVATLETLLNLEAVDKIDPDQRQSPPNRELVAQGTGNLIAGLIGGLPMTSVIIRSSVNINAGGKSKLSAILHGVLLIVCVMTVPHWLNEIPLSALAAILIVTGFKLASPKLFKEMWSEGRHQFLPFVITIAAIVLTDLLTGVLIGLGMSILFILHSNLRRPLRRVMEKHTSGDVLRIELANQVSFLNRAVLEKTLYDVPRGGRVIIDARNTDYIDPDIRDLLSDFRDTTAAARGVELGFLGLKDHNISEDHVQFVDYTSREVQSGLSPQGVLEILQAGNQRFLAGERIQRDFSRQISATCNGQFPMAAVLGCIDSRAPAEVVFDLGLGDIFSARVAGNIATTELLGSLEYACAVVGAKLVVVLGHTSCGAVNAAVDLLAAAKKASEATPCGNLDGLVTEIQQAINPATLKKTEAWAPGEKDAYTNEISRLNVIRTIKTIRQRSAALNKLAEEGKIAIVGALYDVTSGAVSFFQTAESSVDKLGVPMVAVA